MCSAECCWSRTLDSLRYGCSVASGLYSIPLANHPRACHHDTRSASPDWSSLPQIISTIYSDHIQCNWLSNSVYDCWCAGDVHAMSALVLNYWAMLEQLVVSWYGLTFLLLGDSASEYRQQKRANLRLAITKSREIPHYLAGTNVAVEDVTTPEAHNLINSRVGYQRLWSRQED